MIDFLQHDTEKAVAVKTTNLTKKYARGDEEFEANSNVNLCVDDGDFVAVFFYGVI